MCKRMILRDKTIIELLNRGYMEIDPLDVDSIQPASVDLKLGNHFLFPKVVPNQTITFDSPIEYVEQVAVEGMDIILPPHSFALATTKERVKVPDDIACWVEGRSSIGRMGLFVQNAGWVDPGFDGEITLELFNANDIPIKLEPGRRVCQLVFAKMDGFCRKPYSGKYQGQSGAVGSRIYLDIENRY